MVPRGGWNPQSVFLRVRMRCVGNRAGVVTLAARIVERRRSADQTDALGRPAASRTRRALVTQTLEWRGSRFVGKSGRSAGGRESLEKLKVEIAQPDFFHPPGEVLL